MKRIKLLLLIFMLIQLNGQETIATDSIDQDLGQYHPEYEVPSKENRAKTEFHNRTLDENFKDDYKGKQFDYERIVKEKEYNPPLVKIPAGILKFLMYTVLVIIVISIIYYVMKNAGGVTLGKKRKNLQYSASEVSGENLDEIENNNFELLISRAKSGENYRKAIRFYYLWILQKLTDKNLIKWHKEKTSYEYLLELQQHQIKDDFSSCTYIYDHIWYGNFELNSNEFELAESIFTKTLKKLN